MTPIGTLCGLLAFALLVAGLAISDRLSDRQWLGVLGVAWLLLLAASRIRLPPRVPVFNRSLIRTTLTIFTVFVIISAQLVRVQVVDGDDTVNRSAIAPDGETIGNPRLANSQLSVQRGEMYDRNGELIAGTEQDGDLYLRHYPDPATAYVAGYYSPLLYGSSGLESSWDDELSGQAGNDPLERVINNLLNRPQQGADLQLTLDSSLQRQAMELLGDDSGSVVVMDVETGAVIVLASNPNYDPNQLFTSTPSENPAATAYWQSLTDDPDDPLVLRSTLGLYTPGSTFKTITAAIGLELGLIEVDEVFEDNGQLEIDGRILVENNRPDESQDLWSVMEALAWSLNVVFAQIGLRIGASDLWEMADRFGISDQIPFDLPVATGQLANSRPELSDNNLLADTAFGQGQLQVTPLYMCMVTAMYVNDGDMMEPYLVEAVVDHAGNVTQRADPGTWRSPVSPDTAGDVEAMMINAVENGAVSGAAIDGYTVGGKTGTAETGDGGAHQWFIGFIGDEEPRYAVAVVLESGGGGLGSAVAIGRDMLLSTITAIPTED